MTIITDTSYLFALYNSKDTNHRAAAAFAFETASEKMLLPEVALTELAYLLVRDLGYVALLTLLENLRDGEIELVPLVTSDLSRIHDIATTYASAAFDIVDCCQMAIAERLEVTRIATFDRRDFNIFRPHHCDYLDLLPTL